MFQNYSILWTWTLTLNYYFLNIEFLKILFTVVPALLMKQKSEDVQKRIRRMLMKVLQLLYCNRQPLFHFAMETIIAFIKGVVPPIEGEIKISVGLMIPSNITHILRVSRIILILILFVDTLCETKHSGD